MTVLALWLLLAQPAMAQSDVPPSVAPLLKADDDQLINRTYLEPQTKPVGEVRLLRRGNASVVQTMLYTEVLRRVVGEISKKENNNWPQDHPQRGDAARFLDALTEAQQIMWSKVPKHERGADRRQNLLIEFVLSPEASVVLFSEYELRDGPDGVEITDRRLLSSLELSREYVRRNMELIVADSFKVPAGEARTLLAALPGWAQ
ncbi:MAG TPA: hypothetical protein VEB21_02145 [Terriglobales bacterium]|nr:hypothetical protein [Terriglobales bacterium]